MTQAYDAIGRTYTATRSADPRIEAQIQAALGDAVSVLNVGAGTGSYEPQSVSSGRLVAALEPSLTMIGQRSSTAAPVVCGVSEALPFEADCFEAVMAILTVHHWSDQILGLRELRRVASRHVVILTFDPAFSHSFWLIRDYLQGNAQIDRDKFPPIAVYKDVFPNLKVEPVPIPADCRDGFLCAYWKRPDAYLLPEVQAGISSFAALPQPDVERGMALLSDDLQSGAWQDRNQELAGLSENDYGYRLIIAEVE